MSELVTVIMPVFNGAATLEASIQSALRQTWPSIELIIVDDGSTDGSGEIAERHVGTNVQLIRQPNAGASIARNAALAKAKGRFLQYLDADDLVDAHKIEAQIEALRAAPDSLASCPWGRFSGSDVTAAEFVPDKLWNDLAPLEYVLTAHEEELFTAPVAWLVPRPVADRAGPWARMRARNDDAEYFTRALLQSTGTRFVQSARAYYRSGHAGLSAAMDEPAIRGYLWTLEEIARMVLERSDTPRARHALATSFEHFVNVASTRYPAFARDGGRWVDRLGGRHFVRRTLSTPLRVSAQLLGWRSGRRLQRLYHTLRGR